LAGDQPGLPQTAAFTAALRGALLARVSEPGKALVSGHAADGSPAMAPHLAYVPLPFADAPHADGHVVGLALVLPSVVDPAAEEALWIALDAAADADGRLSLVAGSAGAITVEVDHRDDHRRAVNLRPETWTRPATTWATVTPIVLDRQPPRRHEDLDGWTAEQIAAACQLQGLPSPVSIAPAAISPCVGVPPARAFPPLVRKDGSRRWHIHAHLTFPVPVAGPLLLGAGRYRGLGFCRPLLERA
jgi:CRISPR-associated protein Csb2